MTLKEPIYILCRQEMAVSCVSELKYKTQTQFHTATSCPDISTYVNTPPKCLSETKAIHFKFARAH